MKAEKDKVVELAYSFKVDDGKTGQELFKTGTELLLELGDLRAENAYLKKLHALIQSESGKEEKRKSSKN